MNFYGKNFIDEDYMEAYWRGGGIVPVFAGRLYPVTQFNTLSLSLGAFNIVHFVAGI